MYLEVSQIIEIRTIIIQIEKKMFIRFLGESMAHQSAFGFIWPLVNGPSHCADQHAQYTCILSQNSQEGNKFTAT